MIDPEDFPPLGSSQLSGRSGEFLTAYYLTRAGFVVSTIELSGPDIWYRLPDGTLRTVEVKTAQAPTYRSSAHRVPSYSFQVGSREADLFAFVALDKERVLFKRPEDLPSYKTVRLYPNEFAIRNMINSQSLLYGDL